MYLGSKLFPEQRTPLRTRYSHTNTPAWSEQVTQHRTERFRWRLVRPTAAISNRSTRGTMERRDPLELRREQTAYGTHRIQQHHGPISPRDGIPTCSPRTKQGRRSLDPGASVAEFQTTDFLERPRIRLQVGRPHTPTDRPRPSSLGRQRSRDDLVPVFPVELLKETRRNRQRLRLARIKAAEVEGALLKSGGAISASITGYDEPEGRMPKNTGADEVYTHPVKSLDYIE